MVKQALQIAGNQDIHGGRSCLIEGAPGIIGPGTDEICQNVVPVGSADQPADGQSHSLGVVTRQNVTEIAGGNTEIHRLAPGDAALLHKAEIGIKIVDNLRNQPSPVDGVGAGKADISLFQLTGHGCVTENPLDTGLSIVKISVDSINRNVVPLLGGHLKALNLTGARVGIEHRNLDPFQSCVTGQSRFACVAGGGHQNTGRLATAQIFLGLNQQLWHQLKGIILESTGGAMPQLQGVKSVANLFQMSRLAAERRAIGSLCGAAQKFGIIVGQKPRQNLLSQFGIAQAAPGLQVRFGKFLRNKQTPVRR